MRRAIAMAALAVPLGVSGARAEVAQPAGTADAPAEPEAEKPAGLPIAISGRVVVREELASETGAAWTGAASLEDIRLEATYRLRKRLEIVVEVSAQDDVELRDGYLDLRLVPGLHLKAGQFKMPASAAELTSKWKLPTADRGLLSDILDDGLGVTGRRIGAEVTWQLDAPLAPRLIAGAFQGDVADRGVADDQAGLTATARAEIEPVVDVAIALHGASRLGTRTGETEATRLWAGGLDVAAERWLGPVGLRLWADVLAGTSALDTTPATASDPRFAAARATVAARWGGADRDTWYVEPFALASVIDVNLDNADDLAWESAAGIAGGRWRRWRVQLQGEIHRLGDAVPAAITGGLSAPPDRDAVIVQLGAAF